MTADVAGWVIATALAVALVLLVVGNERKRK